MRGSKGFVAASIVLIVLSLQRPLPAQSSQANTGAEEATTIRVRTRLAQVDVVVTDKSGRPVKDLKQSDFTVLQDGAAQKITIFEPHSLPEGAESSQGTAQRQLPPNVFTNEPTSTQSRKISSCVTVHVTHAIGIASRNSHAVCTPSVMQV